MKADRVLETCVYVSNLDEAEAFYTRVLGLKKHAAMEGRHVFFKVGNGMFLVFNPEATIQSSIPGITDHGATGPGHAAFAMRESEIEAWREHLKKNDVKIESEIKWPQGGLSLYFRDPAGNSIELATPKLWGLDE